MRGHWPGGARLGRAFSTPLAVLACSAAAVSCSVLLDWTGYTGGGRATDAGRPDPAMPGDGGADAGDDAPIDAPALLPCGAAKLCAPALPPASNWSGPYALFSGKPGSLPACDTSVYVGTAAFDGKAGLDAGPAQCACSCSPPQGIGCAPPSVTFFSDNACTLPCGPATPLVGCVPTGACTNLQIGPSEPTPGGTCAPGGSTTLPPATWSTAARACEFASSPQGSCASGQFCLPASAPFCITHTGDVPCPAGSAYPFRHVYYQGLTDQRACTQCGCGAPGGAACTFPPGIPQVGSFGAGCAVPTGMPYYVVSPPVCTGKLTTVAALQLALEAGVADAGSCPASGGAPEGGVTPTMPTTFCCSE
jgi:hypothetical protein